MNGQDLKAKIEFEKRVYVMSILEYDYEDLRYLSVKGNSKEAIFPYLVQYNESFYDFLVRTTNRWGEFLYYEDGKLHIGCKYNPNASKSDTPAPGTTDDDKDNTPKDNSPKNDVANIDKWDTLTYYEQSAKDNSLVNSVNNVDTDVVYDEHMLNNPIEKGKYAELLVSWDATWTMALALGRQRSSGICFPAVKTLWTS